MWCFGWESNLYNKGLNGKLACAHLSRGLNRTISVNIVFNGRNTCGWGMFRYYDRLVAGIIGVAHWRLTIIRIINQHQNAHVNALLSMGYTYDDIPMMIRIDDPAMPMKVSENKQGRRLIRRPVRGCRF